MHNDSGLEDTHAAPKHLLVQLGLIHLGQYLIFISVT